MPKLKSLDMYCKWHENISLHLILEGLELPSLDELKIDYADFQSSDGSSNSEARIRDGRSSVTTLQINTPFHGTKELRELLAWPRRLEHISFVDDELRYPDSRRAVQWSIDHFHGGLAPHRASLKTIKLCCLEESLFQSFEFCNFTELESLEIHYWTLPRSSTDAAMKMLGPKLKTITVSAADPAWENFSLSSDIFDSDTARWLLDFSRSASTQGSALEEIHLYLTPNLVGYVERDFINMQAMYTWVDMLEQLQRDIGQAVIRFTSSHSSRKRLREYAEGLSNRTIMKPSQADDYYDHDGLYD